MSTIDRVIQLPGAMEHQAPIMLDEARNKVICAGRRFGKTVLCLKCALQGHGPLVNEETQERKFRGAINGARIWWVAPVYQQAAGVWASLKAAVMPRGAKEAMQSAFYKSEVERTIWTPGGGSVVVKTADNPDNLRGTGIDGVILDEAAFMKEEVWAQVIRPALLDRGGWAFFISTPNGMNWFHDLFESATRENWARWQEPTWSNKLIPQSEIDEMRNDPRVSRLEFQQEIEAQFVAAGAGMFDRSWFRYYTREEGIDAWFVLGDRRFSTHTVTVFTTVDLAVTTKEASHFSVISTWAVTPEADLCLLDCDRFKGEGPDILPRIRAAQEKWRPSYIGIESVGFQLALIQQAERDGMPVRKLTPHKDKVARAMTAVALMESSKVWFPMGAPWLRDLEDEVVMFPEGDFDDFVDTLSYACAEVTGTRFEAAVKPSGISRVSPWSIS